MSLLYGLLVLMALAGHGAVWVMVFNHMSAGPRCWRRGVKQAAFLALSLPVLWLAWQAASGRLVGVWNDPPAWLQWYGLAAIVGLAVKAPRWLKQRRAEQSTPASLLNRAVRTLDVPSELGFTPPGGALWRAIPGNQSWQLAIERKTLWAPQIAAPLSGLTITHLSDLHLTGRVGREYFELVMDEANALESDLIVLTGDIVDHRHCLPWIRPLLGRLAAPHGVYYILGNHDRRPGEQRVREELDEAGLIPLGSRSLTIDFRGEQILLAGDERPWFGQQPELNGWDHAGLRLLLAHTPDRYGWARERGFDVVLAGHTHGGQVRLPLLGAVASPSIHGTRYAGGVFDDPPTVMHVSRGLSGQHPIRWNCTPELAQLTLTPTPTVVPLTRHCEQAATA